MFTVTETKLPDFDVYWEFKEQHNRSNESLSTENVCGKSGIIYNNPLYYPDSVWGESHVNYFYNIEIYDLLNGKNPAYILDIGCGGGGFIEHCVQDGHKAIGIDLGEAYFKLQTYSWKTIPDNLFIRDFGQKLTIYDDNIPVKFDFIHSWDCLEHIKTEDIPQVCENIKNHCHNDAIIILKIGSDSNEAHRTVYPRQWWINMFLKYNFIESISPTINSLRERDGHMFYLQYKEELNVFVKN